MRTITKLVFSTALLSIMTLACQKTQENVNDNDTATEQTESGNEYAETTTVLNANLATESDLTDIGMTSEMTTQILEQRPFLSMSEFNALFTEEENRSDWYKKVFVPMNLNTTAEADFKMIPGVGDRMAHEFEEYRPYTSILQFRREIGKYVDEEEVARYEMYVFVPIELNTATEEDIKALPGVGDRMAHEFVEYRPYSSMEQFRKEIGKYVDDKELARLERFVYLKD